MSFQSVLTLLGGLACWLLQPVSACFLRRRPGRTLLPAIPALLAAGALLNIEHTM